VVINESLRKHVLLIGPAKPMDIFIMEFILFSKELGEKTLGN